MINNFFVLFPNCRIVLGSLRCVLLDLYKREYYLIPKGTGKLFIRKNYLSLSHFKTREAKNLLEFLLKNELGFLTSDKNLAKQFSYFPLEWDYPSYITILTLHVTKDFLSKSKEFLKFFSALNIFNLQLVIEVPVASLRQLFDEIENSNVKSIEIVFLKFNLDEESELYHILQPRVRKVIICGHEKRNVNINGRKVTFTPKSWDEFHDFKVSMDHFIVNTDFYTEALTHNVYFNRRLYIGSKGEIRNSHEDKKIFGNLYSLKDSTELEKIVKSRKIQKHWNINKDRCEICKDCEFRYSCYDSRIPLQLKNCNEMWYYKEECDYNPYIAKWKGQKGYFSLKDYGIRFEGDKKIVETVKNKPGNKSD